MNRVLVIEDDELIQRIIERALSREDMAVDAVLNGKEALLKLEENSFDYQVIITDIMIPYANGLEIVSKVKARKDGNPIPIIIISNASNEEMVADAFKMGVDDFLKKPFSPVELRMRVKRLLPQDSEVKSS
jgi:DNA-binding response OmpR family regulator